MNSELATSGTPQPETGSGSGAPAGEVDETAGGPVSPARGRPAEGGTGDGSAAGGPISRASRDAAEPDAGGPISRAGERDDSPGGPISRPRHRHAADECPNPDPARLRTYAMDGAYEVGDEIWHPVWGEEGRVIEMDPTPGKPTCRMSVGNHVAPDVPEPKQFIVEVAPSRTPIRMTARFKASGNRQLVCNLPLTDIRRGATNGADWHLLLSASGRP
jgi:hypothetical protein